MAHKKEQQEGIYTWFGIINHPLRENASKGDFEAFQDILKKSYSHNYFFASIVHDRDIQEDGTPKQVHMHLFLNTRDKAFERDEIIDKLANDFNIPRECVQVDEATSPSACIKYLTHREQPWKAQYLASDILTNSPKELAPLYMTDFEALQKARNYAELNEWRGLPFIAKYKSVIKDIKQEQIEEIHANKLLALYRRYFDKMHLLIHNKKDFDKVFDWLADLDQEIIELEHELTIEKL